MRPESIRPRPAQWRSITVDDDAPPFWSQGSFPVGAGYGMICNFRFSPSRRSNLRNGNVFTRSTPTCPMEYPGFKSASIPGVSFNDQEYVPEIAALPAAARLTHSPLDSASTISDLTRISRSMFHTTANGSGSELGFLLRFWIVSITCCDGGS
jgi:hypothetical protein